MKDWEPSVLEGLRYVYVLLAPEVERVKIGQTMREITGVKRLRTVASCSPFPLHFMGWVPESEAKVHHCLAAHRVHGEWFTWNTEVCNWLADHGCEPPTIEEYRDLTKRPRHSRSVITITSVPPARERAA